MTKTYLIEIEISSTNEHKKKQAISQLIKTGFKKTRKSNKYWHIIKKIESNNSAQHIHEFVTALFKSIDNVSLHLKTEIKNSDH